LNTQRPTLAERDLNLVDDGMIFLFGVAQGTRIGHASFSSTIVEFSF
jgi:hypothetical protein